MEMTTIDEHNTSSDDDDNDYEKKERKQERQDQRHNKSKHVRANLNTGRLWENHTNQISHAVELPWEATESKPPAHLTLTLLIFQVRAVESSLLTALCSGS